MAASAAGDAVFRSIKASNSVSDEQLSILIISCPQPSLPLWEELRASYANFRSGWCTTYSWQLGIPSGRAVYQVAGESKNSDQYLCFAEHHCTCYAFFYETVNRGEQLCCKHQLAARMADAHKLYKEEKISDEQLVLLLFKH